MLIKKAILFLGMICVFEIFCFAKQPNKVCFQQRCFKVELAISVSQKAKGLMFRESLESDAGMLFIYDKEQKPDFWMKNTYIPLDIIWLNKDKEVVFIKRNLMPCKSKECPIISSDKDSQYVLEINAGTVDSLGLKLYDKLQFYISK